jgi:putative endonuclease
MFVVYLLYSEKFNQIYIGYTSNLIERFKSHNQLETKGHTIKYRPWTVIHVEFFDSKSEAMKREKQLKSSRGRNFCWELIKNSG